MYVHEMDWNSFCKKRKLSQPILYSYKLESYYIYSLIGIIHCNPHLLHTEQTYHNKNTRTGPPSQTFLIFNVQPRSEIFTYYLSTSTRPLKCFE